MKIEPKPKPKTPMDPRLEGAIAFLLSIGAIVGFIYVVGNIAIKLAEKH